VVQQVVIDAVEPEPQVVVDAFEHEPRLLQQAESVVKYLVAHVTPHTNDDFDQEDMVRTQKKKIDEDELAFDIGEEGVNKSDFVERENFENEKIEEVNFIDVHVDQTPSKQKSEAWLLHFHLDGIWRNTHDLGSFRKETDEITTLHQSQRRKNVQTLETASQIIATTAEVLKNGIRT
nr:hypothetical protein [Tanacetum cinerariifolium]